MLIIVLSWGLVGCGGEDSTDSTITVSGVVRGVVNGKVKVDNLSTVIGEDGLYSIEGISPGQHQITVTDEEGKKIYNNEIQSQKDLVKDITIDQIRLTYQRPPAKIEKMKNDIDTYAEAGITDLYIETFFHGQTIYPSGHATQKDYANNYFETLISYAHNKGIRVHAWVETLYWYNLKWIGDPPKSHILNGTDKVEINGTVYTVDEKLLTKEKDNTVMFENGKVFASPFNQKVVTKVKNIVNEIDTKFNVDGISLDYIRFPKSESGAGYGMSSPYNKKMTEKEIHQKRVEAVDNLVEEVGAVVSEDTILSASVFTGYYTGEEKERNKSQAWKAWDRKMGIDWMLPMAYAYSLQQINKDLQFSYNAQQGAITVIPILAITEGHEPIQKQYDEAYSNYNFAGYGIWKGTVLEGKVLP